MRQGFVLGFAIAVGIVACVGDNATQPPVDGGAAGEEGGPCYSDDTCNKNKPWLKCLSKLCVNAGTDGGTDGGGGNDATTDAIPQDGGNDGGAVTCASQAQATANTVRCANGSPCNQQCCFQNGTYTCDTSCLGGPTSRLACDDGLDCPAQHCCLAAQVAALGCPVTLSGYGGSTCKATCASADVEMCGLGDTCPPNKTCVKTTIGGNEYGICVQ